MNIVIAVLIVLFASFVRAVSGFGLALIATPLLTFIMEPKQAIVISVITGGIGCMFVLYYTWRYIDIKKAAFITAGSIFGVFLGAYLLSAISSTTMRLIIASVASPLAILLMLGHTHRFSRDSVGCVIVGFFGGALVASTSMGGPPVVLFLLNQGLTKEKFVGTLNLSFLFTTLTSFGAYSTLGLVNSEVLILAAILVPVLWFGTYVGMKVLPKIQPLLFQRMAAGIVVLSAVAIIVNVLMTT